MIPVFEGSITLLDLDRGTISYINYCSFHINNFSVQLGNAVHTILSKNSSVVSDNRTTVGRCAPAEYKYFVNVVLANLHTPVALMFIYCINKYCILVYFRKGYQ